MFTPLTSGFLTVTEKSREIDETTILQSLFILRCLQSCETKDARSRKENEVTTTRLRFYFLSLIRRNLLFIYVYVSSL